MAAAVSHGCRGVAQGVVLPHPARQVWHQDDVCVGMVGARRRGGCASACRTACTASRRV